MKAIFVAVLIVLFRSCNSVDSGSTNNFTIQTEYESYIVQNMLSVKTTFINSLGEEVSIINAGCGFPAFTLETYESSVWKTAGGPVCVALAVAPTNLLDGNKYEATVRMYAESDLVSGTYRMKFDIRDKDLISPIESRYLYSNSFEIIKQ